MNPEPFFKQLKKCEADKLIGVGEFFTFEEYPELLPAFPNKKMVESVKDGSWKGIQTSSCLRFGGMCHSGHPDCRKLRGFPPEQITGSREPFKKADKV